MVAHSLTWVIAESQGDTLANSLSVPLMPRPEGPARRGTTLRQWPSGILVGMEVVKFDCDFTLRRLASHVDGLAREPSVETASSLRLLK